MRFSLLQIHVALTLYWNIGKSILQKQKQEGWGKQVIEQLSKDLISRYPDDRGYSKRNLGYMKSFSMQYPDFPFLQVPLAKLRELPILQATLAKLESEGKDFVQVPLAQISWYHHISLLPKVKDEAERAYYITETAQNGWSRDVMLLQIDNGYIHAKGHAINNFEQTLPPPQSDLARYIFKDPYNFSFIGTVALQNELDIEKSLTSKITDFLTMALSLSFVLRLNDDVVAFQFISTIYTLEQLVQHTKYIITLFG